MLHVSAWLLALIYNPLIPFHLGRPTWSVVNIATIGLAWLTAWRIRLTGTSQEDGQP
jgi:hypothetical protein